MNEQAIISTDLEDIREMMKYESSHIVRLALNTENPEVLRNCIKVLIMRVNSGIMIPEIDELPFGFLNKDKVEIKKALISCGRDTLWQLQLKAIQMGLEMDCEFTDLRIKLYGPFVQIFRELPRTSMKKN